MSKYSSPIKSSVKLIRPFIYIIIMLYLTLDFIGPFKKGGAAETLCDDHIYLTAHN